VIFGQKLALYRKCCRGTPIVCRILYDLSIRVISYALRDLKGHSVHPVKTCP